RPASADRDRGGRPVHAGRRGPSGPAARPDHRGDRDRLPRQHLLVVRRAGAGQGDQRGTLLVRSPRQVLPGQGARDILRYLMRYRRWRMSERLRELLLKAVHQLDPAEQEEILGHLLTVGAVPWLAPEPHQLTQRLTWPIPGSGHTRAEAIE